MENLTLSKHSEILEADESDSNSSTLISTSSSASGSRKSSRQKNAVDYIDQNLHKIKRRTISRPKKIISLEENPKEVEKFYLNINKPKAVKCTNLETIFEEDAGRALEDLDSSSSCSMNISGNSGNKNIIGERHFTQH